jgi:hypothetical protein
LNKNTTDLMADITDGNIWKEIISKFSSDSEPNNILGILVGFSPINMFHTPLV